MSQSTITFLVLAAVVVVFVWDRIPVAVVAIGTALSLWATGVLDLEQALAGFGDPTVLFIASLFVVSEALEATGVTALVGQALIARVGNDRTRVVVLTMAVVALVTAFITVNASVAALTPVVVLMAVRLRRSPSQLLMPVAFAAHAGSLLALTGTPVNVIISDYAADAGVGRFGFFEFALVGIPLVVGTILIVVLLGHRLLPERTPRAITRDFSGHARTLVEHYGLEDAPDPLLTRGSGVAEVVIPPRSGLIGEDGVPRHGHGQRRPRRPRRPPEGGGARRRVHARRRRCAPASRRVGRAGGASRRSRCARRRRARARARQAGPLGTGAKRALLILLGMVVLLTTGVVPAAVAGLLAAGAIVLSGVLSMEETYRAIAWTTVILVGGMISLSTAMVETGAAGQLADRLVDVVGDAGPHALLLGLFLLTAVLGQLISNMATALIVIPIALSAAADMDVSAKPVLMAVAVSAAAAFLTPVATPANLMVLGPGGYRFGDYWKLGLPLLALFGVVAVLLVPVIWSL